jgi:heat shock protein HslJ
MAKKMKVQEMLKVQGWLRLTLLVAAANLSCLLPATAQVSSLESSPAGMSLQMAQTSSLSGSWRLANMTEVNSPMPMLPSSDNVPTAEFADGRIFGSGGCNRFMGSYQTEGTQLSIGPLASTFMACEPPVIAQETRYLTALQGAQNYEVNPQGLTIFYEAEQGAGVLRFVAQTDEVESSGNETENQPENQPENQSENQSENQPADESENDPVRGLW